MDRNADNVTVALQSLVKRCNVRVFLLMPDLPTPSHNYPISDVLVQSKLLTIVYRNEPILKKCSYILCLLVSSYPYHTSLGSALSQGCASAPTLSLSQLCQHAGRVNIHGIAISTVNIR